MSVYAYVGLPGSGKSYTVVEQQVLPALRQGKVVVTNLPLKKDLICADLRIDAELIHDFPTERVMAEPELILEVAPPGSVLILDEVWKLFPAGLKTNQVPNAFKTVFAEHRHRVDEKGLSTQIVLVTQDLAQISAFARLLVETTFRVQKLTTLGVRSRFRTDVYGGPVAGPKYNPQQALRQIFGRYDARVWRYYTSHTQSVSEVEGVDERPVDARANVLLRPIMIVAPILVLLCLGWGFYHLLQRKHELQGAKDAALHGDLAHAAMSDAAAGGRVRPGPRGPGRALELDDGPQWRVTGLIEGGGAVGGVAWLNDGARSVTVDAHLCVRGAYTVRCPYGGRWYDSAGVTDSVSEFAGLRLPSRMAGGGRAPGGVAGGVVPRS